jgi:hypothetical protein
MRELAMDEVEPGRFEARYDGSEIGLYRLVNGDKEAVVGLGPAAPREFVETVASGTALEPVIAPMRGGIAALSDGVPTLRQVRPGRPASGRGWLGLTPRGAYQTTGVSQTALLPPWLVLLLASGLLIGAWLREGRR